MRNTLIVSLILKVKLMRWKVFGSLGLCPLDIFLSLVIMVRYNSDLLYSDMILKGTFKYNWLR